MAKQITIELPDDVSSQAEALAKEWAIVALQQEGELTIREAAGLLGLDYEDYLALLARKGLPASNAEINWETLDKERARVRALVQERQRCGAPAAAPVGSGAMPQTPNAIGPQRPGAATAPTRASATASAPPGLGPHYLPKRELWLPRARPARRPGQHGYVDLSPTFLLPPGSFVRAFQWRLQLLLPQVRDTSSQRLVTINRRNRSQSSRGRQFGPRWAGGLTVRWSACASSR